jgi:hypothetical protein
MPHEVMVLPSCWSACGTGLDAACTCTGLSPCRSVSPRSAGWGRLAAGTETEQLALTLAQQHVGPVFKHSIHFWINGDKHSITKWYKQCSDVDLVPNKSAARQNTNTEQSLLIIPSLALFRQHGCNIVSLLLASSRPDAREILLLMPHGCGSLSLCYSLPKTIRCQRQKVFQEAALPTSYV